MAARSPVYLDHCATTPLDPRVLQAMMPYLEGVYGNASSQHLAGREAREAIERARISIARILHCKPEELTFTSGGTESNALALSGVLWALRGRRSHLVTSAFEHHSVLLNAEGLEKQGFDLTIVPVTGDGFVDPEELHKALRPDTALVSIMHVSNEVGTIQPIEEIGHLVKAHGSLFHVDGIQAAGVLPLSLSDLPVDLYSIAAHKIYGPKGIGLLYLREGTPLVPLQAGGSHEFGRRAGTENVAGIVGFAKAMELAVQDLARLDRVRKLRERLENEIAEKIPYVRFNGARQPRAPHIANVSFRYAQGEAIVLRMDLENFFLSTGAACATGEEEDSHVLRAMGVEPDWTHGAVRFSFGKDNTAAEIDDVVSCLKTVVSELRALSPLYAPAAKV